MGKLIYIYIFSDKLATYLSINYLDFVHY